MYKGFILLASILTLSPAALAASDTWTIDPVHSSANFTVRHMMISNVRGSFGKVDGTVKYDGSSLKGARVSATIDATSVNTHNDQRDGHLKSPDFLDVAKFPKIAFVSTSVTPTKSGFDLHGELTLHGVTKPVVLHAEKLSQAVRDPYGKLRIGTTATTTINRKDFGVAFNKQMDNGGAMVGDDVAIELDIEFTK